MRWTCGCACGLLQDFSLEPGNELVGDLLIDRAGKAAANTNGAEADTFCINLDHDSGAALGEEPVVAAIQGGNRSSVERALLLQPRIHCTGRVAKRACAAYLADGEVRRDPQSVRMADDAAQPALSLSTTAQAIEKPRDAPAAMPLWMMSLT